MTSVRRSAAAAIATGALCAAGATIVIGPSTSTADTGDPLRCDFNGDGYADLAVGVHREDAGTRTHSGAVNVIYGSAAGLADAGNAIIDQGSPGMPGAVEAGDLFGYALACGDFDNDGHADLAVSSPSEDFASKSEPGTIHIIPGSASGLDLAATEMLHRATPGVDGGPRNGERWGLDIASGDMNADGYDDLVVGSLRLDDIYSFIPGSATGLDPTTSSRVTQSFGASSGWQIHAIADFTGDGYDDLVMTGRVRSENAAPVRWHLIPGSPTGPDFDARSAFAFGGPTAPTAVDVDDDDIADLIGATSDGFLIVASGSADGLADGVAYLDIAGELDIASVDAIATADVDGDGRQELIIGNDEGFADGNDYAGIIAVVETGPSGAIVATAERWHQDTGTIVGTAQYQDGFGGALMAADFDGDGNDDVAIAVTGEGLGTGRADAGAVNVIYGSATGLTDAGNQMWHQGRPGIAGALEPGDMFGSAFAD